MCNIQGLIVTIMRSKNPLYSRSVEFTLILVDKRSKAKMIRREGKKSGLPAQRGGKVPILPYHSFPLPR